MHWNKLDVLTSDGEDVIVHVHLTVTKRHRMPGEGVDVRLLKLTMAEFKLHHQRIIDYAIENKEYKVYCAAHFLCGCSKKFTVDGKYVSQDDELDVLCDEHWKQEVLGISAKVRYV